MLPSTLITVADLQLRRQLWAQDGHRVAFVPTMGALHQGHLSLVKEARKHADRVLVSIFVNPTQFGPNEDLSKYPRTLNADLELLASERVDAVFLPSDATMYPNGFQTYVHGKGMALQLEGVSRKHHFEGVLTVVLKLFNLTRPDLALFGKKDYQQWRLIDQMVTDLNMPMRVLGCDTVREADGLAMSSRNRFLTSDERPAAKAIYEGLMAAKAVYAEGETHVDSVIAACRSRLEAELRFAIDYVELRKQSNLCTFDQKIDEAPVLLIAAKLGSTRLIDNMELN